MKKAQLSIYLDPETFASLEAFAKRHGKPKSLIAEAAIASFLSPACRTGLMYPGRRPDCHSMADTQLSRLQ